MKLLDILLLPRNFYKKINEKKITLLPGIIFIGIIDLIFHIIDKYSDLFVGKSQSVLLQNVLLVLLFVILLGIFDVLFFAKPFFDLFKKFKRESEEKDPVYQLIRLMKVYISAHFVLLPLEIIIYLAASNIESLNNNIILIVALIELILPILFSAAISRGINEIYNFQFSFKRLVFPLVFVWTYALSYAFSFVVDKWLMKLFV